MCINYSFSSEQFWEAFNQSTNETFNDQGKVNVVLYDMQVQWKEHGPQDNQSIETAAWKGKGKDGISIVILPASVVCRQTCKSKYITTLHYYIWHKGGSQSQAGKALYASRAHLWRLRGDWENITRSTSAVGREWLRSIATQ